MYVVGVCPTITHPFQQFVLQERFNHVVGGGEIPRLMDEVYGLEPTWERILGMSNTCMLYTQPHEQKSKKQRCDLL